MVTTIPNIKMSQNAPCTIAHDGTQTQHHTPPPPLPRPRLTRRSRCCSSRRRWPRAYAHAPTRVDSMHQADATHKHAHIEAKNVGGSSRLSSPALTRHHLPSRPLCSNNDGGGGGGGGGDDDDGNNNESSKGRLVTMRGTYSPFAVLVRPPETAVQLRPCRRKRAHVHSDVAHMHTPTRNHERQEVAIGSGNTQSPPSRQATNARSLQQQQ
jgi:hypothetical protein